MSFNFKKDEKAAMSAGIGGMTTGVYKVKVDAVVLSADKGGNPRADFYFTDDNDKRAMVFGMMINEKWANGSDNLDYKKWQEFAGVCGMGTGATQVVKVQVSKTKVEDKEVFVECIDKKLHIALQEVFDVYKGEITNKKNIYRTFFENGKTLAEEATNSPAKTIEAIKKSIKPYETPAYKKFQKEGADCDSVDDGPDSEPVAADEDVL